MKDEGVEGLTAFSELAAMVARFFSGAVKKSIKLCHHALRGRDKTVYQNRKEEEFLFWEHIRH